MEMVKKVLWIAGAFLAICAVVVGALFAMGFASAMVSGGGGTTQLEAQNEGMEYDPVTSNITIVQDKPRGVVCYTFTWGASGASISCLYDPTAEVNNEQQEEPSNASFAQ